MGTEAGTKQMRSLERFWGLSASLDVAPRIAVLVFVMSSIVAMSFCQLGFWPVGIGEGKPAYLMLLLGPLIMGAFLFGPLTGALLGLFSGAVVYAHAIAFPLDYFEMYFMVPVNTFVLLTALGALSGWLFRRVTRRKPHGAVRYGLVALTCLAISLIASVFMTVTTVITYGGMGNLDEIRDWIISSPLGMAVQVLVDAALMTLLCWVADIFLRIASARGREVTLSAMFRNWMLVVSATVFMLTSGLIFSMSTAIAQNDTNDAMMSEVNYLVLQIESAQGEPDYKALLNGYNVPLDGSVIITDADGRILATDDDRYPVGESLPHLLGYEEDDLSVEEGGQTYNGTILDVAAQAEGFNSIQATDDEGVRTMDIVFMAVGAFDGGYVAMLRTADMAYSGRFGTMAASTLLAIALIFAIAVLAMILLNRVVVRRVNETNVSLGKITAGDLNERVNIRDTREFISLSNGINTTVTALKDTIDEVKQHNAQDLATAKTIQESALPREFPPFPHIDRFDLYASMKTAKEVGGDFYDFFLIDDDKLGLIMADVSGKGIPAALFMMAAKTQIQNYMEAGLSIDEAVDATNHQLCIGNDAGMFVTMIAAVLNYNTGALSYVNAGHNPPMLLRGGSWERLKEVSGMPLGLFDGIPYNAFDLQLDAGDTLYLYTDGVTEAMDASDNLFGDERLLRTLETYEHMNARSICVGMRRAITDHTRDAEQSDDITMLCMKYGVPPEKKAVMVLPADDQQLVHVYNFIHEELHRRNAPKSVQNPLDIAAEELFVNVCHYAYPNATPEQPGEVRISFEYEATPPSLTVQIADDGIPYDPLAKPDVVTPDDIAKVPIGGLGILMAKKSVDAMTYERVDDTNVVTIMKKW